MLQAVRRCWRLPAVGAVLTLPAAGAWCAGWVLAHVSDLVGRLT